MPTLEKGYLGAEQGSYDNADPYIAVTNCMRKPVAALFCVIASSGDVLCVQLVAAGQGSPGVVAVCSGAGWYPGCASSCACFKGCSACPAADCSARVL